MLFLLKDVLQLNFRLKDRIQIIFDPLCTAEACGWSRLNISDINNDNWIRLAEQVLVDKIIALSTKCIMNAPKTQDKIHRSMIHIWRGRHLEGEADFRPIRGHCVRAVSGQAVKKKVTTIVSPSPNLRFFGTAQIGANC